MRDPHNSGNGREVELKLPGDKDTRPSKRQESWKARKPLRGLAKDGVATFNRGSATSA